MAEKRNKKTTKVRMLSLSEGTNLPSQAGKEEKTLLITHFSARFHSKTRREIFQIRRLLLHFLPISSSKPSKINLKTHENCFSSLLFSYFSRIFSMIVPVPS